MANDASVISTTNTANGDEESPTTTSRRDERGDLGGAAAVAEEDSTQVNTTTTAAADTAEDDTTDVVVGDPRSTESSSSSTLVAAAAAAADSAGVPPDTINNINAVEREPLLVVPPSKGGGSTTPNDEIASQQQQTTSTATVSNNSSSGNPAAAAASTDDTSVAAPPTGAAATGISPPQKQQQQPECSVGLFQSDNEVTATAVAAVAESSRSNQDPPPPPPISTEMQEKEKETVTTIPVHTTNNTHAPNANANSSSKSNSNSDSEFPAPTLHPPPPQQQQEGFDAVAKRMPDEEEPKEAVAVVELPADLTTRRPALVRHKVRAAPGSQTPFTTAAAPEEEEPNTNTDWWYVDAVQQPPLEAKSPAASKPPVAAAAKTVITLGKRSRRFKDNDEDTTTNNDNDTVLPRDTALEATTTTTAARIPVPDASSSSLGAAAKEGNTEAIDADVRAANASTPGLVFLSLPAPHWPLRSVVRDRFLARVRHTATLPRLIQSLVYRAVLEEIQAAWAMARCHEPQNATFATLSSADSSSEGGTCLILPVSFSMASIAQRIQQACAIVGQRLPTSDTTTSHNNSTSNSNSDLLRSRPRRTHRTVLDSATDDSNNNNNSGMNDSLLTVQHGGRVAMALLQGDCIQPQRQQKAKSTSGRSLLSQQNGVEDENEDNDAMDNEDDEEYDGDQAENDSDNDDDMEHLNSADMDDVEVEDEDVVEQKIVLDNPYLEPSVPMIQAWIGQYGSKTFTTAAIQEVVLKGPPDCMVMVEEARRVKKKKKTSSDSSTKTTLEYIGIPARDILTETDRLIWSELLMSQSPSIASTVAPNSDGVPSGTAAVADFIFGQQNDCNNSGARIVLQLTHDIKTRDHEGFVPTELDEMLEWEPGAFGRTQFTVRIVNKASEQAVDQYLSEQLVRQEQLQKTQRAWDTYRNKGITFGFCRWGKSWIEEIGASNLVRTFMSSESMTGAIAEGADARVTTATPEVDTDFALAQSLAEQINQADTTSEQVRRRKTRRDGDGGGVYYGNQSYMSSKQLMDAILRIVSASSSSLSSFKKPFQTLVGLIEAIPDDRTDPMRRIRTAVGFLVFKRNQLSRIQMRPDMTDATIWSVLQRTPLWIVPTSQFQGEGNRRSTKLSETSFTETENDETDSMLRLVNYVRSLHQIEIQLRRMVLHRLIDIPVALIATAADDREGSMDARDAGFFEDPSTIAWLSDGHKLLNQYILRPINCFETDAASPCYWFQISAFVPSVASAIVEAPSNPLEKPSIGRAKESPSVERRCRFLAIPLDPAASEEQSLVLTEGQVLAGIRALKLEERRPSDMSRSVNPFAAGTPTEISLFRSGNSDTPPLTGIVVGHHRFMNDLNQFVHKILFLQKRTSEQVTRDAVWATLDPSSENGLSCTIEDDDRVYAIQQFDYLESSTAFKECLAIVHFLQKHPKGGAFQEPVDPIALNIPDYPIVIKKPMDVSTLLQKLEAGDYSIIPPNHMKEHSPVARMLNGPFREDVERIFDNAIMYNPPNDWVHQTAVVVKKAVIKKIEQVANTESYTSRGQRMQNSAYVDYDSDVDMYVYESEGDEEYGSYRNKRKKRQQSNNTKAPANEDVAARCIERGISIQKLANESSGVRGPLANLPILSTAADFSLPLEWTCRYKSESTPEHSTENGKFPSNSYKELDELLCLHRVAQERDLAGFRRSTRASDNTDGDNDSPSSNGLANVVYFSNALNLEGIKLPENRLEVELIRERLHETYFAKLHQSLGNRLQEGWENENRWGIFSEGSFPPFLGRIVSMGPGYSPAEDKTSTWEIRDHLVVPALRWVLRGLIHSEHLAQVGTLESPSDLGVVVPNHIYWIDETQVPLEVLDAKEIGRRKRVDGVRANDSEDEEKELSAYEKARAERVARNTERLQSLGLT